MREYKFRAWDNENNQMLDVQELNFEDCFYGGEMQIKTTMYNDYFDYREMPLMQYTGLHDKNGKEIYEGDIVEITKPCVFDRGVIVFINGCFGVKTKGNLLLLYYCGIEEYKTKVIGNIYDNKELLNETNR